MEARDGNRRNVTFPARQFTVHGERRSFSLVLAIDDPTAQDRLRELMPQAYADREEREARATSAAEKERKVCPGVTP